MRCHVAWQVLGNCEDFYRLRLRFLQGVDELVFRLEGGQLDNTCHLHIRQWFPCWPAPLATGKVKSLTRVSVPVFL